MEGAPRSIAQPPASSARDIARPADARHRQVRRPGGTGPDVSSSVLAFMAADVIPPAASWTFNHREGSITMGYGSWGPVPSRSGSASERRRAIHRVIHGSINESVDGFGSDPEYK
jgi:hypothetical protein